MILTSIFLFRGCLFPFVLQVSGVKVRESVVIFFPRTRVNENVFLQDCVQRKSLQSTLVEMFRARVENSSSVRVMRP